MINRLFIRNLLQYYLPFTLTLFMLVTQKRAVTNDDGGFDRLYGFPFGYITNNNGCTGCYEVFTGALIIDLVIYFAVVLIVFKLVETIGLKLKTHWLPLVIGVLISCFWIWLFCLMTEHSRFQLKSDLDGGKTTHSEFVFDQTP
jgi:hypothetical protein